MSNSAKAKSNKAGVVLRVGGFSKAHGSACSVSHSNVNGCAHTDSKCTCPVHHTKDVTGAAHSAHDHVVTNKHCPYSSEGNCNIYLHDSTLYPAFCLSCVRCHLWHVGDWPLTDQQKKRLSASGSFTLAGTVKFSFTAHIELEA